MKSALRLLWLKLHRWIALSLGLVLLTAGFLGALLTVARPLDEWANPQLFREASDPRTRPAASLEQVLQQLQASFGPRADYVLRPPREPGDTLWVRVRGPWNGTVYFDSAGRELGRRGEHEGAYNLLFELHSELLLGDAGKAVLAVAAAAYLVLLASGLVLWWPRRWPPSLRIAWASGLRRTVFDLHRTGGAVIGLVIAVSVASGAYMAWPPLRGWISTAAGSVPAPPAPTLAGAPGPRTELDGLVRTAQSLYPGSTVGYVQVPHGWKPVRVRLKLADDPHPNGLTSVWLDSASGAVLRNVRWTDLDAGNRLVATVYPLHTGMLGGPSHQVLVGLAGLTLGLLGVSGLFLWWKRRAVRPSAA
jgi:uncharacterized iron-regulated membrane protein